MKHSIVEIFTALYVFVIGSVTVRGSCFQRCLRSCCGEDSLCGQAMFRTLIVLSVLLTVCCDSVNTANHNRDRRTCRNGTIFPRDPLVLSGQNLTLICNGPGEGEMWFERGTDAERVPKEYVKKLNRTAIQLDIPISEEDVKNSAYSVQYKCMEERKRRVDNIYVEMDSIFPRDPLVLSGQNLTLICNGPGEGEMWFERGTDAERVPKEYVKKLNRTAIQLDIPISEEDVKNSAYSVQYKCMEKRNRCVDNIYVEMDYYPIEPKNLDCRVLDFETMNCTWDQGIKYKHEEHMNITCVYANLSYDRVDTTLLFKSDNFGAPFAQCPDLGTNWCYWNESEYTSPFQLLVKVVVRNKKNNITVETTLTRHELDMVEPAGVKDLQVIKTNNPRQWVLQWEPTKVFHNYVFNVTVTSACSEKLERRVYYDGHPTTCNITFYDLNPNTDYTFSVKGRIMTTKAYDNKTLIEKGYWSQTVEKHFRTDSDMVDKNPVTALGLYELTSVQDGLKLLTVYFTPLPDCDLHTDQTNVEYIVQFPNSSEKVNSSKTVKHPFFSAEELVLDLPVLNVTLWAKNDIGSNVDPQLMTLNMFGPAPSELIIEYTRTGDSCTLFAYVAVQDNGSQHTNINHTVVSCKGNQHSCSEPLQWKELTSNITQFTFPSKQCDKYRYGLEYRYGLVTHGYDKDKGQTGSTGIHWQPCIYLHGKVPDKPLENVVMVQNPTSRGFSISWQKYDCSQAYITNYTVKYCKANHTCGCREDPTFVSVSGRLNTYSASDLQAGSTVCAWVAGYSKYGIGPFNDIPVMETVTEVKDANDGKSVAIILGSLFGGIILITVILCIAWQMYKKIKIMIRSRISIPSDPLQNHISTAATPLVVDTDETYYLRTSGIGTSPNYAQYTTDTELPSNSESASLLHSDRLENHGGFHSPSDRQRFFDLANNFSANNDDSEDSDEGSELTGYNKPKNIDINVADDSGSPKRKKPKNIDINVADDSGSPKRKKPKNFDINVADDSGSPKFNNKPKDSDINVSDDSGSLKRDLESYSKVAVSVNGDKDNVSVSSEKPENSFSQNKLNKEAVKLNNTDIIKDTDNSVVPMNTIDDDIDTDNTDDIFAIMKTEKEESLIDNKDNRNILKISGSDNNLFTQDNIILKKDGGGCDKQTQPYRLKQGKKNVSVEEQEMELMTFNSNVINAECTIYPESRDVELENETPFDSSFSTENKLATGYRGINNGDEFGDSSDGSESESESKSETGSHDLVPDCNRDSTNASKICADSANHNVDMSVQLKEDEEQVEEEMDMSPTSSLDGYKNDLKVYSSLPSESEQDGGCNTKANGLTNETDLDLGTFKQNVNDNRKEEIYTRKPNGLNNGIHLDFGTFEEMVNDRSKESYRNVLDIDGAIETHLDLNTFKENVDDSKENYERGLNLSDIDGSLESVSDHSEDQLPQEPSFDNKKRNSNEVGSSDESRTSSIDSEPVNYLAAHMSSDTEKTDPVFIPKIINMVVDQNSKTPTKNTNGHFKNQTPAHTNGISHLSKSHS